MSSAENGWGVIFDVDGTMVDNAIYHENAWIELSRRHGLGITRQFYREHIHSRSNDKNVRKLFADKATPELIERISHEKESVYRDSFRGVMKEIAGLTDLLKALKAADVRCGAASNSPKGNVDMVLDELDLGKYFDVVIDRDQISHGKPDPEMFVTTAERLGLDAERCIVVEDSLSGFTAAERAGMKYIVITTGADAEDLRHAGKSCAMYEDFRAITVQSLMEFL